MQRSLVMQGAGVCLCLVLRGSVSFREGFSWVRGVFLGLVKVKVRVIGL